jgi:glycosyltransferase involved in cell wall biosynthesis
VQVDARPSVTLVFEAAWADPELRALLAPAFLEVVETATEAAVQAASAVLAASVSTARQIVAFYGIDAQRVHVTHPGIDHGVFHPGAKGGAALLQRSGVASGSPYVLFVGSVHPRKNLAAVRRAVVGLSHKGFPHRLVVVGAPAYDRPDSSALTAELLGPLPGLPERLVSVPFPVSDADLAALMAGADVFCLPSLMEGLGLPVVEAMACGTVPVVSDRGALPEVVGDAGVVTEPTADAVQEALADLLLDQERRTALARAAHERARELTWARTAAEWRSALEVAADRG